MLTCNEFIIIYLVAQMVKNLPAIQETWVGKIPWRRAQQLTPVFLSGESYRQRSLVGYGPKSQTRLKRLSTHSYNEHQLCTKSRCKSWDPAENKPKAPTS